MGQHKTNPNSILKAQGKLAPKKKKKKLGTRELYDAFGLGNRFLDSLKQNRGGKNGKPF